MAITDYIPNVFGSAAPTTYEGLLGMGLISPEQMKQTQNTANIQGLLGAGLALAQGMSKMGPRRSAAENILGALSGGFGAAGGAYQQGLQNVVQQQQLQSAALTQAQATNRLKAIQQASQQNPKLAQLFAINPEEAAKQMIAMERAKMYGFGPDAQPTQMPAEVPAAMTTQAAPQAQIEQGLQVSQQNQAQPPNVPLINPANVARANDLRKKAIALSFTDKDTAKLFYDEADRLDPKEVISFRDGMAFSNKRGLIANYGGTKPLTEKEVIDYDLDPNKRYQRNLAGNITEIPTTAKVVKLTDEQAQAEGLSTSAGQKYVRLPSNEVKQIEGTGQTKLLTSAEITNNNLDPNKAYQVTPKGDISVVTDVGSVANKADLIKVLPAQFTGVYPTLKPSVDALIARASTMTRDQIIAESEKILSDDAKIREQLDPRLAAQREKERKAGGTVVYPQNSMPLGKEGANKVDTQLLDLGQSRLRLQSISSNFNPKFLETPFKLRMEAVAQLEKLGKKPSPEDAADLAAYSEFAQNAYNELNAYINLITGAAVGSGDEEGRLRKGVPDPQKDSPTQFFTKLNTKIKEGRLYEARLGYIKNKGMKITDAGIVDVNQIPTLMRNREAEIKKNTKLFGNKEYDAKDPNHKAIVRSILSQEFGLLD